MKETRKQKIARQQNAAAGRAADRVCDPIRRAMDAGDLVIEPRAVTPPKNWSPPHPWETCPCDICATRRQFQEPTT